MLMLKVPLKSVLILARTGRDAGKREQHTVKPGETPEYRPRDGRYRFLGEGRGGGCPINPRDTARESRPAKWPLQN